MKPGNLPDQARCQHRQPVSGWMIRGERATDPRPGGSPFVYGAMSGPSSRGAAFFHSKEE